MTTSGNKFTVCLIVILTLLISTASSPNPQSRWFIETIDSPMYFDHLTSSMLKVIDGVPTMAFGGDHLYLRYWNLVSSSWVIETIDNSPGVGSYASLAKDVYGHTYISYYDSINKVLKAAVPSTNIMFPGWDIEIIDSTPNSGMGNAISAFVNGQPHVSYLTGSTLKHTSRSCTGGFPHITCSWSTPEAVDTNVDVNRGTSNAVDSTGITHISYVNISGQLKHAYRIGGGGGNCGDGSNWQCDLIPGMTGIAISNSLALHNNLPRIVFGDDIAGLSFAYKDGTGWHTQVVHNGSWYVYEPSLVLDEAGRPYISYRDINRILRYAWGSSSTGGAWSLESIPGGSNGGSSSIAYNSSPSAYPCILFYEVSKGYLEYTCKPESWNTPEIVADSGNVGSDNSLALNQDGVPHIAYMDYLSMPASPIHATWFDTAAGCNNPSTAAPWRCEQLDDSTTGWGSGYKPSIAINPTNGYPAVSYMAYTDTTSGLGYAWYVGSGGTCPGNTAWSCTTIESIAGLVGFLPSLVFRSNGRPSIAYITSNAELKIAAYMGEPSYNCNGDANWECEVIDTGLGTSIGKPSLALDSDNIPVVSYSDNAHNQLKLATVVFSGGTGCTGGSYPGSWACSVVTSTYGLGTPDSSLALVSDDQALISYALGSTLKLATASLPFGTVSLQNVDSVFGGPNNSLALHGGVPWIAYADSYEHHSLHLARRVGAFNGNCGDDSAWQCDVLDDAGSVGQYPSMAINSAGMVYISYYDDANHDLKLAYTRLFSFMPLLLKP